MTLSVQWLPKGHIAHGYRRVFTLDKDGHPQFVVVFVPMPYESVWQVQQMAAGEPMDDPSLWWGLSLVVRMLESGVLDTNNPDLADDGFLQTRPTLLQRDELLPLPVFQAALAAREFTFTAREER
ncbi:hypothetical protein [Alicyclobacillus herbarius]|uniref:hypothetical protein n=1 Tax=Alicyclobacillus herbarius TaxID=122960 RepID=UPI00041450E0|nr:hypothetical protein [Alicyclobacillus herbarius]